MTLNKIQNIRKDSNFTVTDKIVVEVLENSEIQGALIQFKQYICAEILADSLAFMAVINNGIQLEVNDAILTVNVYKKVE